MLKRDVIEEIKDDERYKTAVSIKKECDDEGSFWVVRDQHDNILGIEEKGRVMGGMKCESDRIVYIGD